MIVAQVLKTVCNIAIWFVIFASGDFGTMISTNDKNGLNKQIAISVPQILNPTWTAAARLAFVFAPSEERTASIVVPILLPRTSAADNSQFNEPLAAIVKIMAVKALDEWINAVKRAPMITPIITPRNPKFVISFIKLTDCGFNDKVFPNKSRPRNNKT